MILAKQNSMCSIYCGQLYHEKIFLPQLFFHTVQFFSMSKRFTYQDSFACCRVGVSLSLSTRETNLGSKSFIHSGSLACLFLRFLQSWFSLALLSLVVFGLALFCFNLLCFASTSSTWPCKKDSTVHLNAVA